MRTPFPSNITIKSHGTARLGTLFFLHANSYSSGLYQPFLKELYEDYEVWAPDLPGHGDSYWTGLIHNWEDLADYYVDYYEHHPRPTKCVGMGHSIGGVIIMLMAQKRPKWFSKIILLDPVLLPKRILLIIRGLRMISMTHMIPLARASDRRRWIFSSRQAALTHYGEKKVFSQWEPQFLEAYVDTCLHPTNSGEIQLACAPQLESSIYQSLPLNAWTLPKRLEVPCFYIIGKHSDTVSKSGLRRLEKLGGNHVVKAIEGGHLFPFEKPNETMSLIKEFLNP